MHFLHSSLNGIFPRHSGQGYSLLLVVCIIKSVLQPSHNMCPHFDIVGFLIFSKHIEHKLLILYSILSIVILYPYSIIIRTINTIVLAVVVVEVVAVVVVVAVVAVVVVVVVVAVVVVVVVIIV
jgi:hypothetical protein